MYVGEQLPAIKENSLYVGFDGEVRKWGEPWVVSKADAETIVSNTEEILEKFELKCVRKKY
jgi:hypothetical protein